LNDEIQIICTLEKININIKKGYLYVEYYEIYISVVNPITIELLKTAKEIEEEKRKTEKIEERKREKKQEEWRKINDAENAKAELEKAAWWLKILIIPGILFLLFIYWFSTWK
jgi:F0F1-type ATP synthase epsilon subunit